MKIERAPTIAHRKREKVSMVYRGCSAEGNGPSSRHTSNSRHSCNSWCSQFMKQDGFPLAGDLICVLPELSRQTTDDRCGVIVFVSRRRSSFLRSIRSAKLRVAPVDQIVEMRQETERIPPQPGDRPKFQWRGVSGNRALCWPSPAACNPVSPLTRPTRYQSLRRSSAFLSDVLFDFAPSLSILLQF
jgi:hypothetical protein